MKLLIVLFIVLVNVLRFVAQGPYAPPAGQLGTTAIYKDSSVFVGWATHCEITNGYQDIAQPTLGMAITGDGLNAIGMAGTNAVVSLGDGGSAVVTFGQPIMNGDGWDFAIFENGFLNTFLELAFVEVSSDGINFFRFPATSLTSSDVQVGTFGEVDATNLNNLAGKYIAQYGTPFDLEEMTGIMGLDVMNITHLKIIDVVGSINPLYASYDAQGNIINDPYPTAFAQGGFDLDAVGVIHQQPVSVEENWVSQFLVYPNPAKDVIRIKNEKNSSVYLEIYNHMGQKMQEELINESAQVSLLDLPNGMYVVHIVEGEKRVQTKIVVNR